MSLRQLLDYGISIQGAYRIKQWNDEQEEYIEIADGKEFEYKYHELEEKYKDATVTFMYCKNDELIIEIEL